MRISSVERNAYALLLKKKKIYNAHKNYKSRQQISSQF